MFRQTIRVTRLAKAALAAGAIALGATALTAPAQANPLYAAIVVDAKTGKTVFSRHADAPRYPASITKVMTLYMLFEAIEQGRVKMDDRIVMSRHAASMPPSKLYIKAGRSIAVRDAIKALVTKSANDVAAAVGEHLGGTESEFARMMTVKAQQLGMTRTTFRNASGLPNSAQKSTARDLARLGIAIREHFPRQFEVFKTRSFKYGKSTYGNHNRLLGSVACVDGIKTGYIRASGFNLLASCTSGKRRIVAVVMGGRSGKTRNAHMAELIRNHVGKATRRGGRQVVARPSATRFAALAPVVPPTPRTRPFPPTVIASAAPIVMASAAPTPPAPLNPISQELASANAAAKSGLPRGSIYGETARLAAAAMPGTLTVSTDGKGSLPSSAVARLIARSQVRTAPATPQQIAAQPVAAYAQPIRPVGSAGGYRDGSDVTGWVVQIAAVEDRELAMKMLSNAKSRVPAVASAQPFTMPVVKGGATLWRARLAGFEGKSQAWEACEALTLSGVACYATTN